MFQTAKAILPDKATGTGVGVGVGARVLVGAGVGLAVADVDTGVGVFSVDATTVAPGTGMISTLPGRINVGLVMSLASINAARVTPKRTAISDSVSPCWTT